MNFKQNEEAVSPVIGVILMVAITVILAAVIAAFVFGMTGNVQGTKVVSIGSKLNNNDIVLTVNGGADLPTLNQLTITIDGGMDDVTSVTYGGDEVTTFSSGASEAVITPPEGQKFKVGDTINLVADDETPLSGRLLVVGKWTDGAEQIILDRTY